MKNIYSLVVLLFSTVIFAQAKFEKGYIITANGERQEVLIENLDWLNNPASIRVKNNDAAAPRILNASEIRKFEVGGATFISEDVSYDKTVENLSDLTTVYEPENVSERITLRKLVGGDLELYKYQDKKLVRYFYRKDGGEIRQLVYKPYYSAPKVLAFNETYKNQLATILTCNPNQQEIRSARYSQKALTDLFVAQNTCANPNQAVDVAVKPQGVFNINLRPRIIFSNIVADQPLLVYEHGAYVKASSVGFGFGVEFEYLFPFNDNRFGLVAEPTFRTVAATETYSSSNIVGGELMMDYKSSAIEIPLSIRYYIPVNEQLKFFVNAGYSIVDIDLTHEMVFTRNDGSIFTENRDLKTNQSVLFGAGVNFTEKFSGEIRYRRLVTDDINNNTFSLILGYNIF